MQKKILWVAAALVLIATPAVIGLFAVRGDDDGPRRSAALVAAGPMGGGYQLVIPGLQGLPSGKAIDVESFSWGAKNAGSADRSGLSSGTPQINDVMITKKIDQTSAALAQAVLTGAHVNQAVLTLFKADASGKMVSYAKYTLTDVLIGSVEHAGTADAIPTEQVSLNYAKMEADFSTLDPKGGTSPPSQFMYDLKATAQ